MSKKGLITTVQRMSIHDGPGIRSAVFLKGCNFRCRWCHNPETWSHHNELQFIASKCIGCMACENVCPSGNIKITDGKHLIDRDACVLCGKCVENCPAEALNMVGAEYSAEELLEKVLVDKVFYDTSDGGVTVSGGEPFLQHEFLGNFLKLCRENDIHTAVETNLSLPWNTISNVLENVCLWMCDLKSMDSGRHSEWIGVGNEFVLENMRRLAGSGAKMLVRTPVIPGFNDSEDDIRRICAFVSELGGNVRYELLAFHTLGFGKFDDMGIRNPMLGSEPLSDSRFEELKKILLEYNW